MRLAKLQIIARIAIGLTLSALMQMHVIAAEAPTIIAPPTLDNPKTAGALQTAVFAGGCFWGVQGVFQHVRGVKNAVSGYAGGSQLTAHYEIVGTGVTDHAESVQVTFDPAVISYGELLQIFFSVIHDPTQLNRQGPDTGPQYRSAIFYADEVQQKIAAAYIAQLENAKSFPGPIVTRVDPLKGFYAAENYHQDYLIRNPTQGYIAYHDLPKVRNFQRLFPVIYREQPVPVAGNKTR
jgi:peptide-methionine (S)-S-oxide reductase